MAVAQKLIAQGLARGRQEGRREGRQEGRADLLLRLLQQRFEHVPDEVRHRIEAAAPADLDRWAARLFAASTLDDVFAP